MNYHDIGYLAPLFLLVIGACSERPPDILLGPHQNKIANVSVQSPRTQGHLVKGMSPTELATFLSKNKNAKVRVLNKKQGFYEVYTQKPEELPGAIENVFIENESFNKPLSQKRRYSQEIWPGCQLQDSDSPVNIFINGPRFANKSHSIQLRSSEKFLMRIKLLAPNGSALKLEQTVFSNNYHLSFTPDQSGVFKFYIDISDTKFSNSSCWKSLTSVEVDENLNFVDKTNSQSWIATINDLSLNRFWHLISLGWSMLQSKIPTTDNSNSTLVAVIDSGVNYNHPAIHKNIFQNKNEIPNNGIDDDNNGFIDDSIGYDFVSNDSYPNDIIGHGSHIAGLIGSDIIGINKQVQILAIRTLTAKGHDLGSLVASLYYAADMGAQIINFSAGWSGNPNDPKYAFLREALDYLKSKNILLVAAAGNGNPNNRVGENISVKTFLPAGFDHENIVVAGAIDENQQLTSYSNFSSSQVDIAAYGGDRTKPILSLNKNTAKSNYWLQLHGTSQAAALVSGALSVIRSQTPEATSQELKNLLLSTSSTSPQLRPFVQEGRYLNLQPE